MYARSGVWVALKAVAYTATVQQPSYCSPARRGFLSPAVKGWLWGRSQFHRELGKSSDAQEWAATVARHNSYLQPEDVAAAFSRLGDLSATPVATPATANLRDQLALLQTRYAQDVATLDPQLLGPCLQSAAELYFARLPDAAARDALRRAGERLHDSTLGAAVARLETDIVIPRGISALEGLRIGAVFRPDPKERLQFRMLKLLSSKDTLTRVSPDALALMLACVAGLAHYGRKVKTAGNALRALAADDLRACTTEAVTRHMPSMCVDRAVLAVLALERAALRGPGVTAALACEIISRVAEVAPWALVRALALLERDVNCEQCGGAVRGAFAAAGGWAGSTWGQREFLEAAPIAVEEMRVRRGGGRGSRLVRLLDTAAAEAVGRFETGRVFELLGYFHDMNLQGGRFLAAYVEKANAEKAAGLKG